MFNILKLLRKFFLNRKISYLSNPILENKYVYLPLHYQPECSSCPMGENYVSQDLIIHLLLKSIPSDVFIYIKPHVRNAENEFLNEFTNIYNLKIIDPSFNSRELICNSLCVATITGTSGFESLFHHKPVLMFGHYFYQAFHGVFKIDSSEDCINAIESILNKNIIITDEDINNMLQYIDKNSIPGWVDNRYEKWSKLTEEENIENIYRIIKQKLKFD